MGRSVLAFSADAHEDASALGTGADFGLFGIEIRKNEVHRFDAVEGLSAWLVLTIHSVSMFVESLRLVFVGWLCDAGTVSFTLMKVSLS